MPSPKLLLNSGKLIEQQQSRNTLQHTNHLRYAYAWRSRNKPMHMITNMHSNGKQTITMTSSNHLKYFFQPNLNRAYKYLPSVFNGPDEVVVGLVSASPSLLQVSLTSLSNGDRPIGAKRR